MSNIHEEEALGKAYDAHLLRRLLQYLRPYRWRVVLALALVAIVTPLELAPPKLFQIAIDKYLVPGMHHAINESQAWRGVLIISIVFFGVLVFDFLAQYIQIRIMQRVGQQTMYDIHRDLQPHSASAHDVLRATPSAAWSPASPPMSTLSTIFSPPASSP